MNIPPPQPQQQPQPRHNHNTHTTSNNSPISRTLSPIRSTFPSRSTLALPRQLSPSPYISTSTSTYTYSPETQAAADAYLLLGDNSFEDKPRNNNSPHEDIYSESRTSFRLEEKRWDLCKGAGCGLLQCAVCWCSCGRTRKQKWMSGGCDGGGCEGMDELRESVENDDDNDDDAEGMDIDLVDEDEYNGMDLIDEERSTEQGGEEEEEGEAQVQELLSKQASFRLGYESERERNCGGGGCEQPECNTCWCQCGLKASNRSKTCYGFHPERGSESEYESEHDGSDELEGGMN